MATYDFNLTAVNLVKASLRVIGAIEEAEEPDASQLQDGIEALNIMIKYWQAQGAHIWRHAEGVLFLEYKQYRYLLGPTGDRACEETDFVETKMDGAQLSGAASITVDSTSGMAASDTIGIYIDSDERHWTTIVSVDSSTTLTITDVLPDDTIDNATVYTYTDKIQRPLRVLQGRRRGGGSEVGEIPTFALSRQGYFDLTNRSITTGLPVEHHYTPIISTTGSDRHGELFLWPAPSNVNYLFKFTFTKPLADIDTNSDLSDFPVEWINALKFNLASEIAPEYRVPLQERDRIDAKAESMLERVLEFDRENAPIKMMPDLRGFG